MEGVGSGCGVEGTWGREREEGEGVEGRGGGKSEWGELGEGL